MTILYSVNVNGLNSQRKRSLCFKTLQKQNTDITLIQETHIKQRDVRLLEQPKLGWLYVSADIKEKKREVAIYIKESYESKLVKQDTKGRWICVETIETIINGKKCLIVNIYAPNKKEERRNFFKQLEEAIAELEYTSLILAGDFNAICDIEMDKKW